MSSFTALTSDLRSAFTSLPSLPLPSQRRLIDSLEGDIFRGKHQIEAIESHTQHFPYHLRSKAHATLEGCKAELEGWYGLLLLYQQAHREGRGVRSVDLERHHRDHPTEPIPSVREFKERAEDAEVVRLTVEEEGVDDRTALLSPHSTSSSSSPRSPSIPSRPLNPHRTALLAASSHQSDFSSSATRTESMLLASAHAGGDTARALAQQRESLMKQRHLLLASEVEAGEGGRAISRIRWRQLSDHLIAWLVVALQVGLFSLIAYVKYFRLQ